MPTKFTPKVVVPRLPPGAFKAHRWNGQTWEGEMKVLDAPSFLASSKNEQHNLWALDRAYREWLAQQSDEVKRQHNAHLKEQS